MHEYSAVAPLLGRSRIRQRILVLLVDDPARRYHLRAIARAVGTSAGTAARELGHLERVGLVTRMPEGAQVYYQAEGESPLLEPVREIVRKSIGARACSGERSRGSPVSNALWSSAPMPEVIRGQTRTWASSSSVRRIAMS